jgi:hypothetical protein
MSERTLAEQGLPVVQETLAMRRQAGRFWVDDVIADMLFPLPGVDFELTAQVLGANPSQSRVIFAGRVGHRHRMALCGATGVDNRIASHQGLAGGPVMTPGTNQTDD